VGSLRQQWRELGGEVLLWEGGELQSSVGAGLGGDICGPVLFANRVGRSCGNTGDR
jgi:hypothetical protein